ncbi:hypothetical protein EsH8_VIII_000050 [Colletotrichum jinshuiense]
MASKQQGGGQSAAAAGGATGVPRQPWGNSPGAYISLVKGKVILRLAQLSMGSAAPGDSRVVEKMEEFGFFLNYLEKYSQVYPATVSREIFNLKLPIKDCLNLICNTKYLNKQRYFSTKDKKRAQALYEWIDKASVAPNPSRAQPPLVPTPAPVVDAKQTGRDVILKPPRNHPIWGVDGIMHGLALKGGSRFTVVINPDYLGEKRSAARLGDNGLAVGSWFPNQLSALFNGAHGHSNAGIYYSKEEGSYSVIVARAYEGLDIDQGDIVYYSGSNAHNNDIPDEIAPSTDATKSLSDAYISDTPVRVLRKANKRSKWSPSHGLRYDGLYKITDKLLPTNSKGGSFEQFKLERIPGQKSLNELREIPTAEQKSMFAKIKDRY